MSGTGSRPYHGGREGFAVRMGLRYVKGLSVIDIDRIVEVRDRMPFTSLEDFSARTQLDDGALSRLAESGALECFKASRRDALWDVFGLEQRKATELDLVLNETQADFVPLNSFEAISWDYNYSSHSTRGHPLAPLRDELSRRRLPDAATVRGMKDGAQVNYAGLVICRQRPGTARGVVFMTLEDETGFVNLVVWDKVFQDYKIIAKTEPFLGVTGKLQVQSGVTHLVAKKLWVPKISAKPVERKSRDFH